MLEFIINGVSWFARTERAFERCGLIPTFLRRGTEEPTAEQINVQYAHGGGWSPMKNFSLTGHMDANPIEAILQYPGDRPLRAMAFAQLASEFIIVFDHAFVAIVQPDGAFEVARMD